MLARCSPPHSKPKMNFFVPITKCVCAQPSNLVSRFDSLPHPMPKLLNTPRRSIMRVFHPHGLQTQLCSQHLTTASSSPFAESTSLSYSRLQALRAFTIAQWSYLRRVCAGWCRVRCILEGAFPCALEYNAFNVSMLSMHPLVSPIRCSWPLRNLAKLSVAGVGLGWPFQKRS